MAIVNVGLRRFSGGGVSHILNTANFYLPLNDLGAGIVSLIPSRGTGSATYSRATTAWTKLSTGLWASIASGSPRSLYTGQDTAVGAYAGYLTELAGTQLITPTASIRDMTNAAWVKVTMTTAKTSTGIDGVANSATRLTAAGATSTILQTLVAAASTRTYSCFMRRVTGTGTILIQQGATTLDVTALINSTTYTRVQLPASVLNSAFGITIVTNTDAIDVDFNQFEAGNQATSPMDAAGAARNADVLTYPTTGNIDFTQGTAYAEVSTNTPTGQTPAAAQDIVGVSGGGLPLVLFNAQAITTTGSFDSTNSSNKTGLTSLFTGIRKRASSWGAAGLVVTGDGATPATASFDGSMGSAGSIGIGCSSGGANQWNGGIKNVRIWLNQFPNPTLQAITS